METGAQWSVKTEAFGNVKYVVTPAAKPGNVVVGCAVLHMNLSFYDSTT